MEKLKLAENQNTETVKRKVSKSCNELSGSEWVRNSISIWKDIKKNDEERKLKHPALFPTMLVDRLISSFTKKGEGTVLDPFCGSGSALLAAVNLGKEGIGFELSDEYIKVAKARLSKLNLFTASPFQLFQKDARDLSTYLDLESVDFAVTSPPYWNILNQKRTADYKDVRNYGNYESDLGNISDYEEFHDELLKVWKEVYKVLKPKKYFVVVVMDLRKASTFYPFHMDISEKVCLAGFTLDDIIIWDRSSEYNNLRALGYPSVFRVNKVHEFILIFQKR